jgi:hypothetical protein
MKIHSIPTWTLAMQRLTVQLRAANDPTTLWCTRYLSNCRIPSFYCHDRISITTKQNGRDNSCEHVQYSII